MLPVRKIAHYMPLRVVDGVPQCHCCQEPMVERDDGWMCALGAAVLDQVARFGDALDQLVLANVPAPPAKET